MEICVKPEYVSVACNRVPEIVDWNNEGLMCYGASNAVIINNTKQKGGNPLKVLSHHRARVNSVKWIQRPDGTCNEFLSCSADKTAAIWTLIDGAYVVTSLEGHTDGVTSVAGLYLNQNELVVFTASIDSTVRVWKRCTGIPKLVQTISLHGGLCLTLHAHMLPKVGCPILILALDDHKVHIYVKTPVPSGVGDVEEYHKMHALVGHEDWVRGLDVLDIDDTAILIASASQDTYIRLWRIQLHSPRPSPEIRVEERVFSAYGQQWAVTLDAVLAGHEGWVYGVQFTKWKGGKETSQPTYRLLSSSLDKTLIIWEPSASAEQRGVWVERVRVGEVGGNGLGFYGARFGPAARKFVGHGYNGSFHVWTLDEETHQWLPSVVCGGHFGPVEDVQWGARGRLLASAAADQTTRVHALWDRGDGIKEWHELARPQVHGYDMSSLALVSATTLVSAAEEKVVRVFRAPHNFVENFKNITGVEIESEECCPEGASVPSLGLSNKAVFADDDNGGGANDNDGYFTPITLTEPPTEETLQQNTLWPETHKLYGHGYEVHCVAAAPDGGSIATACRATTMEHASVIIWETKTWQQIQKLTSHTLTVTQIAFSPDSQQLLSVSRDRRWTLYQRNQESNLFEQIAVTDKNNGVHGRIIWCCAWAHDGEVFSTGSRDGKVCVWSKTDTLKESSLRYHALYKTPLEVSTSVTALAFAPLLLEGSRLLAVGLDSGVIKMFSFSRDEDFSLVYALNNSAAHHLTVKRLMFNPREPEDKGSSKEVLLASCGSDHLVRIYNVIVSSVTS
ncbi:elongator complex protein 2 [Plutella xylostella]|uniref:elongator complex protein 2 n=1 Tax=Plutella xylostella TaxID=51655 RepID=UPI00203219F3|nr:elongator complex protein 2 [Plutella xylostella]